MSDGRSRSGRSAVSSSAMSSASQKKIEAQEAVIKIADMELKAEEEIERKRTEVAYCKAELKRTERILKEFRGRDVNNMSPEERKDFESCAEDVNEARQHVKLVQDEMDEIYRSLERKKKAVMSRVQASAAIIDELDENEGNKLDNEEETSKPIAKDVDNWVNSLPFPHEKEVHPSTSGGAQQQTTDYQNENTNPVFIKSQQQMSDNVHHHNEMYMHMKYPHLFAGGDAMRSTVPPPPIAQPPPHQPPMNFWNTGLPNVPHNQQYSNLGHEYYPPRPPNQFEYQRPHMLNQGRSSEVDDKLVQLLDTQLKLISTAANQSTNATGPRELMVKSNIDKDLPFFSGDPGQFNNFKSAYHRSSKKYKFDSDENIMRLQKALKGDAKTKVLHLMANPNNLNKILETLEKTYGRPEFVLDYLVEKAKNSDKVQINKPETLIKFGDCVDALITNVCSYNKNEYMYNKQLTRELIEKLPYQLQDKWYEWRAEDETRETNLKHFSTWLEQRVNAARLRITPSLKPSVESDDIQHGNRRTKRGPATVHVAGEEKGKSYCASCKKEGHTTAKCWKFAKKSNQDKWNFVKDEKLCFLCLRGGHRTTDCKSTNKCTIDGCDKNHHTVLHQSSGNRKRNENPPSDSESDDGRTAATSSQRKKSTKHEAPQDSDSGGEGGKIKTTATTATSIVEGTDGALPIVPVYLRGPKGEVKTYALLDTGASRSLIEEDLAAELGLDGTSIDFKARGFGGHLTKMENAKLVKVGISGYYRGAKYAEMDKVVTVKNIGVAPYSLNLDEAKKKWPCLRQIKGKSLKNAVPRIIVGTTHRHLTVPRQILCSKLDGPVATRTLLGWVLEGDLNRSGTGTFYYLGAHMEELDLTLHNLIKENFKLENFGIVPTPSAHSIDDRKALQLMAETTKKTDTGWETGLLWRNNEVKLPSSYEEAFRRLNGTERRMQRDSSFHAAYMKKIQEYKDKMYIRKLEPAEITMRTDRTFYIPHFGVTNPNKPGKFRLVFDAAAKAKGVSLNDCLLTGPELLQSLTSVLWNFRRHRIVISGDIEDMFHRVRIRKEDQCSQRFLWRDGDQSRKPDVYEMEVMIFGATSSPSSAIYVKNVNAEKFIDEYLEACRAIKDDFYMDDCLTGDENEAKVIKLRRDITFVNKEGGFNIKKWITNSKEVLDSIPPELRLEGARKISESQSPEYSERVLGLWWDPSSDHFTFKCNFHKVNKEILDGRQPTKREVCSLVMSLYDPLGFIGHYRVKGMMILQCVWNSGIGWDDEIPEEIYDDWKIWLAEQPDITTVRVPRFYGPQQKCDATKFELHTFVVASKEAYAAVCYYRVVSQTNVDCSFVSSKVKVAPLKKLTIPKLELQAALLGAKLATSIIGEVKLKVDRQLFWTDSRTVLCWIRSSSARHPEFVANRVGALQDLTNIADWRWIPTALNVADDATRLNKKTEFEAESRWFSGPPFLKLEESEWPSEVSLKNEVDSNDEDAVLGDALHMNVSVNERCGPRAGYLEEIIPQLDKFSSYTKLLRVITTVFRLARRWLSKIRRDNDDCNSDVRLPLYEIVNGQKISTATPEDMLIAEQHLIKWVQNDALMTEDGQLQTKTLKKLRPYLDEFGVLRARGRIDKSEVPEESRRPIILPAHHKVTDLIVEREHKRNAHTGHETVLSNLRKRFWIIHGRQAVRRCWTRCNFCRIRRSKPVIPEMGVLPSCRVASGTYPFTYTGVDYFGPVEVTVGRRHEKRWGVLFTCMVTRAIHLEVAHGLSTDETILALSRFVNVRRRPRTIFSYNGTNFHGAIKELERAIACQEFRTILEEIGLQEIQWKFIPPAAAHMGGAWERLIQAVKKVMKNILHERYPKDTVLETVMKSAENIVNSRPITYLSSDVDDPEALTPNHFVKCGVDFGPTIPSDVDSHERIFREKWKEAEALANRFWERWTKEYLPTLLRREKWLDQVEPIEVGDLVLILDDQLPRNCWVRAVVTATFPAADGQVRTVEVTTRDFSTKRKTTLKRPVTKLCPLGLRMDKSSVMTSDLGAGNVRKFKGINKGNHQKQHAGKFKHNHVVTDA